MVVNRIREWRTRKGWSMQQLADSCSTSRAQIDKLERGERRLTVDWMVRLAKPLGCRPAELLPVSMVPGLGAEMSVGAEDEREPAGMCESLPDSMLTPAFVAMPASAYASMIPVRSAARGGGEQEMFLEDGPIDYRPCPCFVAHVRDAYAIYVVGESMVPMYRPGQILYVNPHKPLMAGRGVVVTKVNKAVLIKELVRETGRALVLREYQPIIREFRVDRDEIFEAHGVVGAEEPGG